STFTQMGGEGGAWIGLSPFTDEKHIFVNMGDGTYFHSGLLAIRAAIAAKVNATYKILHNDAVAMTGGQAHDGTNTVPSIVAQLLAEGVREVVVVAEQPDVPAVAVEAFLDAAVDAGVVGDRACQVLPVDVGRRPAAARPRLRPLVGDAVGRPARDPEVLDVAVLDEDPAIGGVVLEHRLVDGDGALRRRHVRATRRRTVQIRGDHEPTGGGSGGHAGGTDLQRRQLAGPALDTLTDGPRGSRRRDAEGAGDDRQPDGEQPELHRRPRLGHAAHAVGVEAVGEVEQRLQRR
ncbi:MAG: hypothetical protein KDB35_16675, partial [Acidimicrobiales bacterium]|nr:hypothetical protein [Acidimicrobiales bacterium]